MEVYKVNEDDLTRVGETELGTEAQLEEYLIRTDGSEIGGIDLFYIDQQGTPDNGGRFDILAVDREGRCIVVELKRDKAPREIVVQALEYASGIRNESYETLEQRYEDFAGTGLSLAEAHQDYFDLDDPLPNSQFNSEQRLVLVGAEFRDISLKMADLLRDYGLDIVVVAYSTYATSDEHEDEELNLLTTEPLRRPMSQDQSGSDSEPNPWELDGKAWHQKRTTDEAWKMVTSLVEHLSGYEGFDHVSWRQKNYIAFYQGRTRLVKISTSPKGKIGVAIVPDGSYRESHIVRELATDHDIPEDDITTNWGSRWPLEIGWKPEREYEAEQINNYLMLLLNE